MVNSQFVGIKYILLHTVILIIVATIPIHFYINSEMNNESINNKLELSAYAQKVANKIYKFSNSDKTEFFFPRSNVFKSAIYNKDGVVIFSLLDKNIQPFSSKILENEGIIYLKYRLKNNVFNASTVIVSKKISHKKIVINVLSIMIITMLLALLATIFIIKQTAEPYKKFNEYLENFIKDAMHEMKTPLGVILLNLDILDTTYTKNKMVRRAKSALKNMMVVYEDLEFFVRKNVVENPKTDINLSNFCKDRINFFMDLLNSKKITIIDKIEENIIINFNELELSRIIDNTISNAIKYSKNNTTIYIFLNKNDDLIKLKIKDQGKGIENCKDIFNRYYRGDKISGGFGIGLNIVKNICDKNSVHINVTSKVGTGSTFTYTFRKTK